MVGGVIRRGGRGPFHILRHGAWIRRTGEATAATGTAGAAVRSGGAAAFAGKGATSGPGKDVVGIPTRGG